MVLRSALPESSWRRSPKRLSLRSRSVLEIVPEAPSEKSRCGARWHRASSKKPRTPPDSQGTCVAMLVLHEPLRSCFAFSRGPRGIARVRVQQQLRLGLPWARPPGPVLRMLDDPLDGDGRLPRSPMGMRPGSPVRRDSDAPVWCDALPAVRPVLRAVGLRRWWHVRAAAGVQYRERLRLHRRVAGLFVRPGRRRHDRHVQPRRGERRRRGRLGRRRGVTFSRPSTARSSAPCGPCRRSTAPAST